MFIVGLLSWWYGAGWALQARKVQEKIASMADYFSIGILLKTLFNPFRQISAGQTDGPLAVKWRAFVDRLISRCIGAMVRTFMIVLGIVAISLTAVVGAIVLVLWLFVPLLPLVGFGLMVSGWVPTWM